MATLLLVVLVLVNVASVWRDRREYARFKSMEASRERRQAFARWILESFLLYGVTSILVLAVLGRLPALSQFPPEMAEMANWLRERESSGGFFGGLLKTITAIAPLLLVLQTVGALFRAYRGAEQEETAARDVYAIFPRNSKERRWTGLLSLNAGLSEELFFRLAAPLLIASVTGSIVWGVALATLWFGLVHTYQGWAGIAMTTVLGVILLCVYLFTGSIWIAALVHALLDLNDLWIGPAFGAWLQRRET